MSKQQRNYRFFSFLRSTGQKALLILMQMVMFVQQYVQVLVRFNIMSYLCHIQIDRRSDLGFKELQNNKNCLFQKPKASIRLLCEDQVIGFLIFPALYSNKLKKVEAHPHPKRRYQTACRLLYAKRIWTVSTFSQNDDVSSGSQSNARQNFRT